MMLSALCTLEHALQFGAAIFAAMAAITWLSASRVKTPDGVTWSNEDALARGVTKQSRLNALAALFAAMAAFCQIPLPFMPTCWN